MLALGDALAVALLRLKGFSARDFHTFHPGGKLGAALKRVTDLMHHTEMPLCAPNASFAEVVEAITAGRFGCCGIIENGRLIGIITDGDLRRMLTKSDDISELTARDIMSSNPKIIENSAMAVDAREIMETFGISNLLVEEDGRYHDGQGHLFPTGLQPEREYESPVSVVQQPEQGQ